MVSISKFKSFRGEFNEDTLQEGFQVSRSSSV